MEDKRLKYADKISLERIEKLHPSIRNKVKETYLNVNMKLPNGIRLRISQGVRTLEEQDALYAQGRTTKGKIVTNAKSGTSWHNWGLAFDIVILYDLDGNGSFETASWDENKHWMMVVSEFKKAGFAWEVILNQSMIPPHFEMVFGLSTSIALSRLKAGDVITDAGMKYININKG